jgi:DNA invertase Pin-like site-specific DNA recombinase
MSTRERFAAFEQPALKARKKDSDGRQKRAVGYVRVSTDEQQLGPEAQEAAIRAYAARAGLELLKIIRDTVSGGAPLDERPALVEALDALTEHSAGKLIVAKRDRLARDTARALFAERLIEQSGAQVVTADGVAGGTSPEDKLLRGILDVIAEYERAAIRVRTRAALAAKKRRGERLGQVPFGYAARPDKTLVPVPQEQAAIAYIVQHRDAGVSWDEILAGLQASFPTRGESGRWHHTSAQRIYRAAVARRTAK